MHIIDDYTIFKIKLQLLLRNAQSNISIYDKYIVPIVSNYARLSTNLIDFECITCDKTQILYTINVK